jgi:hypothetical protein
MGLFGSIIKLGLDIVETPIAIVKDVATFGEYEYTSDKLEEVSDDYNKFKDKLTED